MTFDVACLGDLVMDLVPEGGLLAPSPGGAPGNVAAGLAKLGRRVAMLAKVGDEGFGREIIATLSRYGVDTSGIVADPLCKTRLSVVTLSPEGERSFIFYKDNPADAMLRAEEIDSTKIADARILHVGSLLLASPVAAEAQRHAMEVARRHGRLISADPNLRPSLWPDSATMIAACRELVASAQIVKLSEDELLTLSGEDSIDAAVRKLWHPELRLLAVTKGAAGAVLFTAKHHVTCDGYRVATIDTLAAGDAFMAALLSDFLDTGPDTENEARLALILRRACAAGALATTRKGAMASLPAAADIDRLLASA